MPPKKRAAAASAKRKAPAAKAAPKSKRAKKQIEEEEEEEEVTVADGDEEEESKAEEEAASSKADIIKQLRAADANKTKSKIHAPDKNIPGATNYQVVDDYDAMLNQTNIGANNNKFYVIQVLKQGASFYAYTRWGRVGETGSNQMSGPFTSANEAIKQFKSKFKDKTKNDWDKRDQFVKVSGKYDLIDVAGDGDDEEEITTIISKSGAGEDKDGTVYAASKLDKPTQSLIRLLFDADMFKEALKSYDIDVKKMPLGKLSKSQIAKGFEILEELEAVMENKKSGSYADISSKFYTTIPHDFGRTRPKAIDTREALQQKYDMLAVLADIEIAQSIQKDKSDDATAQQAKPHPYDVNYGLLKCSLDHLDVKSDEFKVIKKYTENTQGYRKCQIIDVWRVGREGEGQRFKAHDKLTNRKLLWHGTSVAVVVAILKSGLRIMPHSGGRVGKGIYFASENGKSSGYVGVSQDQGKPIGIMFLNEVALGNEHSITADNPAFKKAPAGFDSVVARGQTEPDPKDDTSITIEGKQITVPAGKPIPTTYSSSSFSQSEYLVYQENQCRIRYMLKMQF
jgi:poly [ADP-ribose] polymerase